MPPESHLLEATPFQDGVIITDIDALPSITLEYSFGNFINKDKPYRYQYLQQHFGQAFDGYSFYGQQDSKNQSPEDMLHSFVFSDFYPIQQYPVEFQPYLSKEWQLITEKVRAIEISILQQFSLQHTLQQQSMGHMMSANFYPATDQLANNTENTTRLSEHPDVSLMTVFPFGIDQDFEYQLSNGSWQQIAVTNKVIVFSGYLMEWLTRGAIKALNHRVRLATHGDQPRYSFALFSLPYPQSTISRRASLDSAVIESITAEQYFQQYLNLWDY
ncbi:MAG: 2OG-Fe(II) oxygenase family protein [Candidatus Endonucleobacter sp. (ex Gigantidas childressi)]|nr:2OG-Fe(II) oxygenase family protein [Candidatus Endonucleobacter sp. (ex Gigantidas childressi)]